MSDRDRVEKTIEIRAPRSRVWRALANGKEFGAWFGLGEPLELVGDFVPGAKIDGAWVVDGKEVREHFFTIETIVPERTLSFFWVPYEVAPGADHDKEHKTRIEFQLEDIANGTRLTVVESGFAKLPADKQYTRARNGEGWAIQAHAIAQHVLGRIAVKVEDRVARPIADVLEAIVDPARMSKYFISNGSARMESGKHVDWEWSDVGAKLDINIRHVGPDRVTFIWSATGEPTQVTLALSADGDGTKIVATELPFELSEEAAARAIGQTQGWTDFCCCLKAYLQHGIDLRRGARVA
jgi:uncharacterized protein YndB with AHSA1/START domain